MFVSRFPRLLRLRHLKDVVDWCVCYHEAVTVVTAAKDVSSYHKITTLCPDNETIKLGSIDLGITKKNAVLLAFHSKPVQCNG